MERRDAIGRVLDTAIQAAAGSWIVATYDRPLRWREVQELRRTGQVLDTVGYREIGTPGVVIEGMHGIEPAGGEESEQILSRLRGDMLFVVYVFHTSVVSVPS